MTGFRPANELNKRDGEMFWLRIRNPEMTYREIAERYGVSVELVRFRVNRHRKRRRAHYDKVYRLWLRENYPEMTATVSVRDVRGQQRVAFYDIVGDGIFRLEPVPRPLGGLEYGEEDY